VILVVDDHEDTAHFLCRLLGRKGFEVTCCHDGPEAMEWLRTAIPQLIILDVQMPGLSGLDVLALLRDDDRLRIVPVIIYSAGLEQSQERSAFGLGAKEYLVKGCVDGAELIRLVTHHATPLPA
jgi:CheY-like chemotaxis protein